MMKAVQTHKPLRRSKPINLPVQEHDYDAFLIQFSTRSSGGFAISCDGIPVQSSIEELISRFATSKENPPCLLKPHDI